MIINLHINRSELSQDVRDSDVSIWRGWIIEAVEYLCGEKLSPRHVKLLGSILDKLDALEASERRELELTNAEYSFLFECFSEFRAPIKNLRVIRQIYEALKL